MNEETYDSSVSALVVGILGLALVCLCSVMVCATIWACRGLLA